MTHFARHRHDGAHLRRGVDEDVDEARDVLWTFGSSPQLWKLLVMHRGWTPDGFASWMGQMLIAALLPSSPSRRSA